MITTNPQGIIQDLNQAAERLLGYTAAEVVGQLTPILFYDSTELLQGCNLQTAQIHNHVQPGIDLLLAQARCGICDEGEWTYISKQGDLIPVKVSITSLQDDNNNHLGFLFSGQDLKQQKQAEITAQTADHHFRRMVANIPGMIYQYVQCADGSGFFPFVGYNCSSMFEVSQELVQQDANVFWQMVHPDDFFAFKVASSLAGKTLQSCEVELEVRTPSGQSKWIQSIARPTQKRNGNLIWDGVMIDISDRKRLEAERDRFFNLPLDILGVLHSNGIFRQVNTAITDILGYSVSSLTSMPLLELVHPEDRYTTRTAINRLSEGTTECFEVRCRCQNGTYKWIAWKAIPVNESHLIYAIGRDITATKASEAKIIQLNQELEIRVQERTQELQKTYQQLSFLIENFQLALIEWDADFRIQRWSPEAEKLFGWTTGNVIGKSPRDWQLIHEDDIAIAQQSIQKLLDGSQSHATYSVRNYTRHKSIIYCEWFHSALIDESGQLIAILSLVVDRTTRKQAEDELKASQHRFSTAFERSPAALSITTFPDGIQLDVNESWVISTGYSREEAIGRKSSELQFWEFQAEKDQFIQQLNQNGSVRNMLVHSRVQNGEVRKILLSSDLIELDGQSCLLNSAIDITEQKNNEELLIQQLAAIEASIDGIAILDTEQRYTYLNQAYAQLFGFQGVNDLLGKSWRELYEPSEVQRFESEIFPIFLQQGYWRGEAIGRKQDGTYLPQEVALTRLSNGGLTCICRDITERKAFEAELQRSHNELEFRVQERTEALRETNLYLKEQIVLRETLAQELAQSEQALRQSQAQLQAFFNNAETMISIKDRVGRYLVVNQKFLNAYGLSEEKVIGYTAQELFSPQQVALIISTDTHVLTTGNSIEFETVITHHDHRYTYLTIKFPLLNTDGSFYGVGCISTDITARKHAENQMMKTLEREKDLSNLKTRFITDTSHEFRTPLTTILGSTELLERAYQTGATEKQKKHCDRIKVAVKHMTQLLDDILIISQAEAGKISFDPILINLTTFCQSIIDDLAIASGHETTIQFTYPEEACLSHIDEKIFRQILENILINAVKYSPSNSTILCNLSRDQDDIILQIQDNGIGIPQDDLPHLFEPFYRASNVGIIPGTGLGLSIVQKAIALHHGTITVTSQANLGSTFTITLPQIYPHSDS